MAGEALDTGTALKVIGWAAGGIAYGAGLIVYVKQQLKSHSSQIADLKAAQMEFERKQAVQARQEDLKVLREDMNKRLDLILEVVKAANK